ncbi:MAG: metallophosphoesterase family protein [Prochlorothrix sp.]|nr:metallophosphoesterase [Prochlorothrix sp.]
MRPFTDPPLDLKIAKMKERVRWQHPWLRSQDLDQTRLVVEADSSAWAAPRAGFSFLVMGDTGWGPQDTAHPQRHIAQRMVPHLPDCCFTLHTGDVVYTLGSKDFYPQNFIEPYREWLVGGAQPAAIAYDRMVFRHPIFPTPGNHDYCHMPLPVGIAVQGLYSLFRALGLSVRKNIGWRGSNQGEAYARAFMDYLQDWDTPEALLQHLQQHYTAQTATGRCLSYRPGHFTRVPNRYYSFTVGGIDFFALDSTTLNQWSPSAEDGLPDREQRQWLRDRLIQSWQDSQVRGRILFFHHPPYVTEATKWKNSETYAMRQSLRWVFDAVLAEISDRSQAERHPVVDLVLAGHAHCLEYLQTGDTGHGDAHLHWWVCGGSGCSTRRQRREGDRLPEWPTIQADWIPESLGQSEDLTQRESARSHLYVGKTGQGDRLCEQYSFLRIDVAPGDSLQLTVRPFVSRYHQGQWHDQELPAIRTESDPRESHPAVNTGVCRSLGP